jgi:hypothetical protein
MACNTSDITHQIDEASFRIYQMQHLGALICDLLSDCGEGTQAFAVKNESLQVVFGMIEDELKKARMELGEAGKLMAQRRAA